MKKCPFCGADIEDSARFCLYCMQSLTEKEQIRPYKRKKPQWMIIIAAIIVAAVMSMGVAIMLFGKQAAPDKGTSSEGQPFNSSPSSNSTEPSDVPLVTDPPHIHNYCIENTAAEYLRDEATCTVPASFYYSCACGEKGSVTFSYGKTANHAIVIDRGYPATCVKAGLTDGNHCSVCNIVFLSQNQIPVINHTFDNDQDDSCNVCNYVRTINCNHSETVKLSAVAPTCTAGGLSEGRKCVACEEILTAQIALAPLGHTEEIDQAVAAACTTDGKTEGKHCSVCQIVLVYQQDVPALGHSFDSENPANPCSRCGIIPHIHSFTEQNTDAKYLKTAAECTTPARYYYSCNCGEKGDDWFYYGYGTGHTVVTEPGYPAGCVTPGLTKATYCSVCKDGFDSPMEIDPVGHTFALGDSPSACLVCGEMGTVTIQFTQIPIFQNDSYRIDRCTYAIRPSSDEKWLIDVSITYTNITNTTSPVADISLYLCELGYGYGSGRLMPLEPQESDVCSFSVYVPNSCSEFELRFT